VGRSEARPGAPFIGAEGEGGGQMIEGQRWHH
jgi:hypothetical protein